MDHVGRIGLEIAQEAVPVARSLSHGLLSPGRYVRIAVSDHRNGIDAAALQRIFEPFFTTRATGNGLGLATVREIVREHGGAMHVQSTLGDGGRFEVWLPCVDAPAYMPEYEPALVVFGHGETVLVLEASANRLMQDEELLAVVGYEPVGFTHVDQARAAYLASPERFDAALVGHIWPPGLVLAFATALLRASPDLPILLAASTSDAFGASALVGAGFRSWSPGRSRRPRSRSHCTATWSHRIGIKHSSGPKSHRSVMGPIAVSHATIC